MSDEAFESDEAYGPGSDLMISLFSISILLLGIVGVGQQFGAAQDAVNALSARPPVVREKQGKPPEVPPLQLISPQELAEEAAKREAAEARATELESVAARDQKMIDVLNGRLAEMRDALDTASVKLQSLRTQLPAGRLEILSHKIPARALATFLDDPSLIAVSLNKADVKQIRSATTPFVPHANQIFIETAVPPELFAFMPEIADNREAISRIYLLSAAIAQAYQQAFARDGVPLVCISLVVHGFEESPEVRREAVFEATDAVDAFSELAAFYKPMDRGAAGGALASIRVLLGSADERPCDAGVLENRLSSLRPE